MKLGRNSKYVSILQQWSLKNFSKNLCLSFEFAIVYFLKWQLTVAEPLDAVLLYSSQALHFSLSFNFVGTVVHFFRLQLDDEHWIFLYCLIIIETYCEISFFLFKTFMAKTWCNKVQLLTSFKVTFGVVLGVYSLHHHGLTFMKKICLRYHVSHLFAWLTNTRNAIVSQIRCELVSLLITPFETKLFYELPNVKCFTWYLYGTICN